MKFPKPKSLPGLFLYGIGLAAVFMIGRLLWAVFDLNFEKFATDQGWDSLLANNASLLGTWFMNNLFWVSLSTASAVAFALGAWTTLGVLDFDKWWRARIAPSTPKPSLDVPTELPARPSDAAADPVKKQLSLEDLPKLPRPYLYRRAGENPTIRPHLYIEKVRRDVKMGPRRAQEVIGSFYLRNKTSSDLGICTIKIDSVVRDGVSTQIDLPLLSQAGEAKFSMRPDSLMIIPFLKRTVNVAPEAAFYIPSSEHVLLQDWSVYDINLSMDSGAGVITRAVIQAKLSEFEEFDVTLIGQAGWKSA